jgi:hypothetical protein
MYLEKGNCPGEKGEEEEDLRHGRVIEISE